MQSHESGGRNNRQPLTGEPYDATLLLRELRERIAAALPASGGRGAPSRPHAQSVYRGVLAREALRAGYTPKRAFVFPDGRVLMPVDASTRRRWERAVQALERAEGLPIPDIPHDASAFQRVEYATRRWERWLAQEPSDDPAREFIERRVMQFDVAQAVAMATGSDFDANERETLDVHERFVELRHLEQEQTEQDHDWAESGCSLSLDQEVANDGTTRGALVASDAPTPEEVVLSSRGPII